LELFQRTVGGQLDSCAAGRRDRRQPSLGHHIYCPVLDEEKRSDDRAQANVSLDPVRFFAFSIAPVSWNVKKFIQIWRLRCLWIETVNGNEHSGWLEGFYAARAAGLILYGRALGLGHGEAEDVLQETFLALMRLPEPPREPENYCVRSFRNRALNYKRSLWRRLTREVLADSHHFAGGSNWFEKAQDEAEQSLQTDAVRCLEGLPVEQREVIVLKIWNQFTFEEIGGLLEISPNTVAGRYRYGLQKIKSKLEGVVYERDGFTGEPIAFVEAAQAVGGA